MLAFRYSKRMYGKLNVFTTKHLAQLEKLLGADSVKTSPSITHQFARDEGHFTGTPSVVVLPKNAAEVSAVLRVCNENSLATIPFGTGTGAEGGAVALQGGVCMSLLELSGGVLTTNIEDFDCSVRPSITRQTLNEHLKDTGLFFPVDPGADASICGMVATSASGTNAVKYGTMKENVLNLEVVLADGSIIHTKGEGRRARKSSAGFNLTELFVGSEGTLGVITAATVRLHPRPAFLSAATCNFSSIKEAVSAVVDVLQMGVPIARIELLDDVQIAACNAYSHLDLDVKPTLFLEFHGSTERDVDSQRSAVESVCSSYTSSYFQSSSDEKGMGNLWKARHNALYAALSLRKGSTTNLTTDVCVPISKLAQVVTETKEDLIAHNIFGTIVGHVGDGNFHVILPTFEDDKTELEKLEKFSDRLVGRALGANGTCTGEHGVGLGKIGYLEKEMGPNTINVMKNIKKTLDPKGILNPGKVLRF